MRYDLAGFTVGVVDKAKILDNSTMQPGDVIIALPSTGVHSNGFSLVRKIFDIDNNPDVLKKTFDGMDKPLGEALLAPPASMSSPFWPLWTKSRSRGVSHITGGGFYENIPRSLKKGCAARIAKADVRTPALFDVMQREGRHLRARYVQHLQHGRWHGADRRARGRRQGPRDFKSPRRGRLPSGHHRRG